MEKLLAYLNKLGIKLILNPASVIIPSSERTKFLLSDLQALVPSGLSCFESHSLADRNMVNAIKSNPSLKPEGWVEPVMSVTICKAKPQNDEAIVAKLESMLN